MSRAFWGGVMVFSAAITAASAYFLTVKLEERATRDVPLRPVAERPAPQASPSPESLEAPEDAVPPDAGAAPTGGAQPGDAGPPPETDGRSDADDRLRNILFTFHSSGARDVHIIGDFNRWFREPLERKSGRTWTITKAVPPGRYEYVFVVDGRRLPDPNNRRRTSDGRSILVVNPPRAER